jgi:hypothetical protein
MGFITGETRGYKKLQKEQMYLWVVHYGKKI